MLDPLLEYTNPPLVRLIVGLLQRFQSALGLVGLLTAGYFGTLAVGGQGGQLESCFRHSL